MSNAFVNFLNGLVTVSGINGKNAYSKTYNAFVKMHRQVPFNTNVPLSELIQEIKTRAKLYNYHRHHGSKIRYNALIDFLKAEENKKIVPYQSDSDNNEIQNIQLSHQREINSLSKQLIDEKTKNQAFQNIITDLIRRNCNLEKEVMFLRTSANIDRVVNDL